MFLFSELHLFLDPSRACEKSVNLRQWNESEIGERLQWWMDDLIGCRDWSGCTGIGSLWAQVFWNTTLKEILAAVIFGQRNLECEKCLASLSSIAVLGMWSSDSWGIFTRADVKEKTRETTDQKPWAQTVCNVWHCFNLASDCSHNSRLLHISNLPNSYRGSNLLPTIVFSTLQIFPASF